MELPELPDLTLAQARASRAVALRDALDAQITETEVELRRLEDEDALLELVANLIRRLIDAEVTDGVKAVEKLQTEGLQTVFHDQDLSVRAEVEESRGKVAVTLLTGRKREDGAVVEGVADQSFGGSVLTMQSILMRITVIFRRDLRPLLLLDETLVAVANKYVDRAAKFLSTLCKRLDLDVLLITHDEALVSAAHRAYYVTYANDRAKFTEVSASDLQEASP
jgi:hypothetical protein